MLSNLKYFFRDRRLEKLRPLSQGLGLHFSRKEDYGLRKKLSAFKLFQKGSGRKIVNLMSKDDDWLISSYAIFDYHYTIQHGKTSTTYKQTVFFMDSKKLGLPPFIIKPEHFFHRIGKYLGLVKEIEFESEPEFNEKFLIQSEYPDMMEDLVSKDLIQFFNIENKWTLEGINHYLIFYREHKRLEPEVIKDFYRKGVQIVEMLTQEE